jgi:putative oxidoreductase
MSGQAPWCAALLDPDLDVPPGLVTWNGSDPVQRFAIYRNNVEGLAIDLVDGTFQLGWPRLSDSAVALFQDEYRLPLLSPELGATAAAFAEHLFPLLLLIGLGTRFSALALLGMTAVIQVLVYPDTWPVHGTWATILLYLAATGPGRLSLDHWSKHWALRSGPLGGTVGGRVGALVPWRR